GRGSAEEPPGCDLDRVHPRRSGGAGEGVGEVRQGQSGIQLQGRCGRTPRDYGQGDRVAGDHAVEGRALFEAVVPVERSGAASGYDDECGRKEPGGGRQPGRGTEQIQGSVEICNWEISTLP